MEAGEIIHDAAQGEMLKVMDNFYPILRVKDIYNLESGCDRVEDGIVMWLESGEISYCLLVDELRGEQQVVVKPLHPPQFRELGLAVRSLREVSPVTARFLPHVQAWLKEN